MKIYRKLYTKFQRKFINPDYGYELCKICGSHIEVYVDARCVRESEDLGDGYFSKAVFVPWVRRGCRKCK